VVAGRARLEACRANPVKVAAPELVRAKRDVADAFEGVLANVLKGSVLPADHEFALAHPDDFEPAIKTR
jgi:hypothetical protein